MCRAHKNGMTNDNAVENIVFRTHSDVTKSIRPPRSMPVMKVDKDGNVVAIYKSQKEAAQKNYMSTCAMWHWCHGRRKDSYALDGYKYVLEGG